MRSFIYNSQNLEVEAIEINLKLSEKFFEKNTIDLSFIPTSNTKPITVSLDEVE